MSPFPFFSPRKRAHDWEPASEPESDSRGVDDASSASSSRNPDGLRSPNELRNPDESVFELVPPPKEPEPQPEPEAVLEPEAQPEPTAAVAEERPYRSFDAPSRNVHSIGITDLSRLSIDNDGRLYWDGKPVEVRRRIAMSRAQVIGALIVGAFVAIGALGAAVHGSAAALDMACRMGWNASYCGQPDRGPPPRPDIPA